MSAPQPAGPTQPGRLHVALATWPMLVWGVFHVWEQWAAFGGRLAWLARMRATSSGVAIASELVLAVAPLVVWAGLYLRAVARRERLPGMNTTDAGPLGRGLAALVPFATPVTLVFLLGHVAWLWGAKMMGAAPVELYDALQRTLGLPWALALHAVGLTAIGVHLAAVLPESVAAVVGARGGAPVRALEGETQRALTVLGLVVAVCFFVLFGQLVGWFGTGAGTFWPIQIVPAT